MKNNYDKCNIYMQTALGNEPISGAVCNRVKSGQNVKNDFE